MADLRELAEGARAEGGTWWLWDEPEPLDGYRGILAFAHAASPEAVVALLDRIDVLERAVERMMAVPAWERRAMKQVGREALSV